MSDINTSVKKACSIAEGRGCEITQFDEISALMFLGAPKSERHRKAVVFSHFFSEIPGIEFEKTETPDGYIFLVTANGY